MTHLQSFWAPDPILDQAPEALDQDCSTCKLVPVHNRESSERLSKSAKPGRAGCNMGYTLGLEVLTSLLISCPSQSMLPISRRFLC